MKTNNWSNNYSSIYTRGTIPYGREEKWRACIFFNKKIPADWAICHFICFVKHRKIEWFYFLNICYYLKGFCLHITWCSSLDPCENICWWSSSAMPHCWRFIFDLKFSVIHAIWQLCQTSCYKSIYLKLLIIVTNIFAKTLISSPNLPTFAIIWIFK